VDGAMDPRRLRGKSRYGPSLRDALTQHGEKMASAELPARVANEDDRVTGRLEIHRHREARILDDADRRDEEARRDREHAIADAKLVVEAVLSRDERSAEGDRRIMATSRRLDERPERLRSIRPSPAEVVEDRGAVGIGAGRDDVSHRLVDGRDGHAVRVEVAVA